ncbi:MAG: hypothetical protein JNK43_00720 [Ignavibacteria bacterium]|nr:hypothetical protein [Ignavibacteria bacterium]
MSILAGEKFFLKLLPSDIIALHEECEDNRYGRLLERFRKEKVLYNPLIVGDLGGEYMLIDGANRFEALKQMECRSILAQVVNYSSPEVVLKSWYHFVNEMTLGELEDYLNAEGISFTRCDSARRPESRNSLVVTSSSGSTLYITFSEELEPLLGELSKLNRFYGGKYSYMRIDSDTDITDISSLSSDEGLLVIFPDFSKNDIAAISKLKQKLPAGISRHLIPNRVLHIKILLDALKSGEHLEKRNEELQKYIQYKIDTKRVRLYREPILVFDE